MRAPSEIIAMADSIPDGKHDFVVDGPVDPAHGSGMPRAFPGTVHRGGANVLFCDGHVQWYPQKILTHAWDLSDHSVWAIRRMWNADNWASETEH